MHYIIESFIVGIYCMIIYLILINFIENYNLLLFILGFIKHIMGYYLGLHKLYCNYGFACNTFELKTINTSFIQIFIESILEGFVFYLIGSLFFENKLINIFCIGIFLHLISETFGLHTFFCKRCIKL
jgi:hypothetical protein